MSCPKVLGEFLFPALPKLGAVEDQALGLFPVRFLRQMTSPWEPLSDVIKISES